MAASTLAPPLERPAVQALYLHVPFCFHKCHYCDFYSIAPRADSPSAPPTGDDRHAALVNRLIDELTYRAGQVDLRLTTVFVGGGTPTLLAPELWRRLLAALHTPAPGLLARVQEFTVEANPETVTAELAVVLASGGVNRISLGAQSFNPALLKTLERWHEPPSVARAVQTLRAAGINNINLDLIFAIPGQTLGLLDADLDAALALVPDHISCYGLTYEPHTAMTQRLKLGQFTPVDEDLERAMYQQVMDRLAAAGFEHYEVSNWARVAGGSSAKCRGGESGGGRRCLHNLAYWENRNWLGLGPSAASHIDGYRWKNEPHLGHYLAETPEPPTLDHEFLPPERRAGEEIMLRLRLRDGVTLEWLRQRLPTDDPRWGVISEMTGLGLLEQTPNRLRLSDRGLFVADSVLAKLL